MNKKLVAALPAFMLAVPTVLAQPRQETTIQTTLLSAMRARQAQLLEGQKICDGLKPLAAEFERCGVIFKLEPTFGLSGTMYCMMMDGSYDVTSVAAGEPVEDTAKSAMTPKRMTTLAQNCPQQYNLGLPR